MNTLRTDNERVAVLENNHQHMSDKVDEISTKMDGLDKRLRGIEDILREAKGGWKVFLAVGAVSAGVGAAIAKIITFLASMPWPK